MTYVLDKPVSVGKTTMAALSKHSVITNCSGDRVAAMVEKKPVALLFDHEGQLIIAKPDGGFMTSEQAEKLLPGVIARFKGL